MTSRNIQKPNDSGSKNASFDRIKPVISHDHRFFKHIFLHHKIKHLSKKLSQPNLPTQTNSEELSKNIDLNMVDKAENKAFKDHNSLDQSGNITANDMNWSTGTSNSLIEENLGILAQVRASFNEEDLKCLFRKILLNFRTTRDEASFFVKYGVFTGTHFNVKKNGNTLDLSIKYAQKKAACLLTANKNTLKERLACHQIELGMFKFS